jgi:hypothetical protein
MRIDDFICLGRAVPENSKKYGRKVCMAGYSEELRSFVRIYPLPVSNPIHQRSFCRLELTRPRHDSRDESWRLTRESEDNGILEVLGEHPKDKVMEYLTPRLSKSIASLNIDRKSLGVIRAHDINPLFRNGGKKLTDPDQLELFDDVAEIFGPEAARLLPYIQFRDAGGCHELQVREWGCYEWLRKEPEKASQLWDNLRLGRSDSEYFFFVGNMCHRRNVWLIISIYHAPLFGPLFSPASFTTRANA